MRRKDEELAQLREEQEAATQLGGVPATPSFHTENEAVLQERVAQLHTELASFRESEAETERAENDNESAANWTLAARDPWDEDDTDAFMHDSCDIFDENTEMAVSTPAARRIRQSFPSPPDSTLNTPSRGLRGQLFGGAPRVGNFNPTPRQDNYNIGVGLNASLPTPYADSCSGETTIPIYPVRQYEESHTGETTVPNSPSLPPTHDVVSHTGDTTIELSPSPSPAPTSLSLPTLPPSYNSIHNNYTTQSTGIQTSFSLLANVSPARRPLSPITSHQMINQDQAAHIANLNSDLAEITEILERNQSTQERLSAKLAPFMTQISYDGNEESTDEEKLDAALDSVLTHLTLAQEATRHEDVRFDALSTELISLFPSFDGKANGDDNIPKGHQAEKIIDLLKTQFRSARLDLERLFPGEQSEGFDNSTLLTLLISRLRTLVNKVERQDADIDAYHEQEVSLRKQLSARVDAMKLLQSKLQNAENLIMNLEIEADEKDDSLQSLKRALESYRDEVGSLEACIEKMDKEKKHIIEEGTRQLSEMRQAAEKRIGEEMQMSSTLRTTAELQHQQISELETRLSSTTQSLAHLQSALDTVTAERNAGHTQLEAFRTEATSAVSEREHIINTMHAELQSLTSTLASSQEEIQRLRNSLVMAQETGTIERRKGREAVENLKAELRRVLEAAASGSGSAPSSPENYNGNTNAANAVAIQGMYEQQTYHAPAQVAVNVSLSMDLNPPAPALEPIIEEVSMLDTHRKARDGRLFDRSRVRRRDSKAGVGEERPTGVERKKKRRCEGGPQGRDDVERMARERGFEL